MVSSLYFHFPFCSRKCPYCHFFVLPNQEKLKKRFLKALLLEWEARLPLIQDHEIVSLYFGGGTPTLFPEGIAALLRKAKTLNLLPNCEITVEANPEDVTPNLLAQLRSWGVNRISLGIQSFDDSLLKQLSRTHDAEKALEAVYLTKEAGFDNITIDLMYELPYQTTQSWKRTLSQVQDLPITHLSLYNLVIEPQTGFYRKRQILNQQLPPEEERLQMLEMACKAFEKMGLKRYEISAFAKEGFDSKHNTGYWTGRPFLGFGPSAFSYWEGKRFRNVANLMLFQEALEAKNNPVDFEECLPYPRNLHELIAVGIRLCKGLNINEFEKTFSPLPTSTRTLLNELEKEGYLYFQGCQIALTDKGRLFYDSVAERIVL